MKEGRGGIAEKRIEEVKKKPFSMKCSLLHYYTFFNS